MQKKIIYLSLKIIVVLIFSLFINQYYGNIGVFPIETFSHYDLSFRVSRGDIPFKDYWAVSGIFIDYIHSLFLKFLGESFQIYVLHASLLNAFISLFTFLLLLKLGISENYAFIYSILFSLLAYTTSGTLYVDHHASILCLASTYFFVFYFFEKKNIYIFFVLFFLAAGLLTKVVPTSYFIIFISFHFFFLIFYNRDISLFLRLLFYSILILSLFLITGSILGISLKEFFIQYFLFPLSIGSERLDSKSSIIIDLLITFKEIIFIYTLLIYFFLKSFSNQNQKKNFNNIIILSLFTFMVISLITHQYLTQNQEFIYFLIPLLFGLLNYFLDQCRFSRSNYLRNSLVFVCVILVLKFHFRINESRRFHELENVNLANYVSANIIDNKLSGLKWITPIYPNNAKLEVEYLNEIKNYFNNSPANNSLVFSNYSFLSIILDINLNTPGRWFIPNGGAYPINQKNKFFNTYKEFLRNIIIEKKINKIYFIHPVSSEDFFRYFEKDCFEFSQINEILSLYKKIDSCKF